MTSIANCPQCGNTVKPDTSFCALCGASLKQESATDAEAQQQVESAFVATEPVCQNCGTPAVSSNQKYCAICGGRIEMTNADAGAATSASVAPMPTPMPVSEAAIEPVVAAPAAGAQQDSARAAVDPAALKDGLSKFQSNFNDFMGASIDTSAVGKDFNASTITLEGISAEQMSAAFSFFGKSYSEVDQPAFAPIPSAVERRKEAETRDDEARTKAGRDFSATEGYMVYGALASKLQPGVGPTARMVESQRKKAWDRQKKDRLKHQVALGEISQEDAVELAKD